MQRHRRATPLAAVGLNRRQHLPSARRCHVHPRPSQDVSPAASPRSARARERPSEWRILPSPGRRERAAVAPPFHLPPPTGRATAAISPRPLQAGNAAASAWKPAARIARKPHDGAMPVAASPSPSPSRCRPPLALHATCAARDGPCRARGATNRARHRLTASPCRLDHRRSLADCHRRRCRRCHRRSDKESTLLLKLLPERRSTAALPMPLPSLAAVVPRR